nr:hypothetical protein B0A51_09774 [Rachicladosporium sp. CCFEE 5018]
MASKRPHSAIHPSRSAQVPAERPAKKQKPSNLSGKTSFKKAHPLNHLKTESRSLTRLLSNSDLPPKIRIEKERALASAQTELAKEAEADKRGKMIARWHKVRFFDRQKATKRLKRARKAVREEGISEEERAARGREVDECEVDVAYAIYYPLDKAYVALYPSARKKDGEDEEVSGEAGRKGDETMREVIRKCIGASTLDALRHGRLDEAGNEKIRHGNEERQKPPERSRKPERKTTAVDKEPEASDDGSDGGFFE